jgi:hypothetical protein
MVECRSNTSANPWPRPCTGGDFGFGTGADFGGPRPMRPVQIPEQKI